MNKIERQILSYKLVIASCLIIIMGSVGYVAKASGISDEILDRVAEKIANSILGDFDSPAVAPSDEMLGDQIAFDKQVFTQGLWMNGISQAIYFGTADQTYGIRDNAGTLQSKNSGGTWATLGATTPGDEGWIAYEPLIVPATNEEGYRYLGMFGGSNTASSSITNADATTVLISDGGFVTTGTADFNAAVEMDTTLTVDGTSTLTGNVSAGGTLAVTGTLTQTGVATFNADPIVAGTTPTLTIGDAGAEDTSLVFHGAAQDFYIGLDDDVDDLVIGLGSALGTTPAISITEAVGVTIEAALNGVGAADFDSTVNIDGAATVAAITGDGNWTTTGNLAGANLTASGNLTAGGSLYVINSGDNVGIGSSTPFYRLSVVDTSAQLALSYDTAGQVTFGVDASDDLTIVPSGGDVDITGTLAISSTLAVTGASTFTGATTLNGSALIGIGGALDAATATALSIGTSTATSIEIADTSIVTNIQGPLTAAETVSITGAFTSAIDIGITDGRLVGGVEATPNDCAVNAVTIALATDKKTVVVADQKTDAACAVTFSGGTAGEIVVLDLIYGGDKAWTFAAGGQYIGDTFDESACIDFQATAADGDHLIVTGVMTDADTIMPLSCQYLDQ